MTVLERRLFKRDHFPLEISYGKYGLFAKRDSFYVSSTGGLPPYHPSMEKDGISLDVAISVLDESIENTLKDFEMAGEKMPHYKLLADGIRASSASGRSAHGKPVPYDNEYGGGVQIVPFPIAGRLNIEKDRINPGHGAQITIHPSIKQTAFLFPREATLPDELMEEYQMKDKGAVLSHRSIRCPYGWYSHNVWPELRILYKNLVMAIDNEVVRRKYGVNHGRSD